MLRREISSNIILSVKLLLLEILLCVEQFMTDDLLQDIYIYIISSDIYICIYISEEIFLI